MKNKTKFRDLPIGAKFFCKGIMFEKVSSPGANCKHLATGQTDWLPGSQNVFRVVANGYQTAWIEFFAQRERDST